MNWPQPAKKERTCLQNSRSGTTEENRPKTASAPPNPPAKPSHMLTNELKEYDCPSSSSDSRAMTKIAENKYWIIFCGLLAII